VRVKLTFKSINLGNVDKIVDIQTNVIDDDIKALFPIYFNVPYSKLLCKYEILKEGD
jgi:hypothetical protein